jgi:hypothetical protein
MISVIGSRRLVALLACQMGCEVVDGDLEELAVESQGVLPKHALVRHPHLVADGVVGRGVGFDLGPQRSIWTCLNWL